MKYLAIVALAVLATPIPAQAQSARFDAEIEALTSWLQALPGVASVRAIRRNASCNLPKRTDLRIAGRSVVYNSTPR